MLMTDKSFLKGLANNLLSEELSYNTQEMTLTLWTLLGFKWQRISDVILELVEQDKGKLFFIYSHRGISKKYL